MSVVEEFVAVWNDGHEISFHTSREEIRTYIDEVWTYAVPMNQWIEYVYDTSGQEVEY